MKPLSVKLWFDSEASSEASRSLAKYCIAGLVTAVVMALSLTAEYVLKTSDWCKGSIEMEGVSGILIMFAVAGGIFLVFMTLSFFRLAIKHLLGSVLHCAGDDMRIRNLAGVACVLVSGCLSGPVVPPVVVRDVAERPDLKQYVVAAESAAATVLEEFNSSEASGRLGGPFARSDYRTEMWESQAEGREFPNVSYFLSKQVLFSGHPQHFAIRVCKNNGETKVFKGR